MKNTKLLLHLLVTLCFLVSTTLTSSVTRAAKMYPASSRVQGLQLNQSFTISYKVIGKSYDHGDMLPVKNLITLSYDGSHLLYRSEDLSTRVTRTVLYDGVETYTMDSNSLIAEIQPGFDFSRMPFCPLPGVGIPKVPLLSSGFPPQYLPKIMTLVAPLVRSEPSYIASEQYTIAGRVRDIGEFIYADDKGRNPMSSYNGLASVVSTPSDNVSKVLWYDTFDGFDHIGRIWDFRDQTKFENVWLAKTISMKYFVKLQSGKHILFEAASYNLTSSVARPLDPKAYDPTTYLLNHASIGDMTGQRVRSFVYYVGGGPLQDQRRKGLQLSEELAVTTKSRTNSGLIGLLMVMVMTIIWFMWRRTRETHND